MDCADIRDVEADELRRMMSAERRPYTATLEITQRCNNRCVHCYLDPARRKPPPDLPLEFLLELLDALIQERCLWLSITGGEPLLRPDFPELYTAAKRRGFLVVLYTNARLITEEIADMLYELPPRLVSISLYGATDATCQAITQTPGAFEESMAGIKRVHERGLRAHLKTMALRSNYHELGQMKAIADDLGWQFLSDSGVRPTIDGDTHVLAERLPPETAVELDFREPEVREAWMELVPKFSPKPRGPRLFNCYAGRLGVFVDAEGYVTPCSGLREMKWALDPADMRTSLRRIFYEQFPPAINQTATGDFPCGDCMLADLCTTCPGWREREAGSMWLPCEYGCRVAELRAKALGLDLGVG